MNARSIFNAHSKQKPIRRVGGMHIGPGNQPWYEDLPYYGPVLNLKDDDPEELRPVHKVAGHVEQFALNNEEHVARYTEICNLVCAQRAQISFEERVYDDSIKSWRVLVRWMEMYYGPSDYLARVLAEKSKGTPPPISEPPERAASMLPVPSSAADGMSPVLLPETDTREPLDLAQVLADAMNEIAEEESGVETEQGEEGTDQVETDTAQAEENKDEAPVNLRAGAGVEIHAFSVEFDEDRE